MTDHARRPQRLPLRRPLAACLLAVLACSAATVDAHAAAARHGLIDGGAAAPVLHKAHVAQTLPAHPATTFVVSTCDDSGSGSLRDALAQASVGDIVDLTALACSRITLTTGYIAIDSSPSIVGPGADLLTIDGNHQSGVFQHFAASELLISGVALVNGYYRSADAPFGGCVYSTGSVTLQDSVVRGCTALATGDVAALGGGVYTRGELITIRSTISGNLAQSTGAAGANGGGVYAKGFFESNASSFGGNAAYSTAAGHAGAGGGVFALAEAIVYASTIYLNVAEQVGGIVVGGVGAAYPSSLTDSTISPNSGTASVYGAGIYTKTALTLGSSTVTGNVEANGNNSKYGAGLSLGESATVDLESTIVFGNVSQQASSTPADDVGGHTTVALTGSHDLVNYAELQLPPDTIAVDPQLQPLAANGGPTLTHALPAGSPAIDAGTEVGFAFDDQRGDGFPRSSGRAPDIGAYEYQQPDTIFADGFD